MTTSHLITAKQRDDLTTGALEAAQQAYAPYSHFHVGAALLLTNDEIVCGCNVENASYRLTNCAEQVAIGGAVMAYGPETKVKAVAIANLDPHVACMPCGACRQTLLEFATDDCTVFYPGEGGEAAQKLLRELLPESFRMSQ